MQVGALFHVGTWTEGSSNTGVGGAGLPQSAEEKLRPGDLETAGAGGALGLRGEALPPPTSPSPAGLSPSCSLAARVHPRCPQPRGDEAREDVDRRPGGVGECGAGAMVSEGAVSSWPR